MEITAAALAAELCGASQEDPLLAVLCEAAEAAWESRLDPGVTKEDCGGALRCAAAFMAAADYLGKQCRAESFTVGEVTVRQSGGRSTAVMAETLRQTAERLMRPYAASGEFCFRGGCGDDRRDGGDPGTLRSDRNAAEQRRREVRPGLYPACRCSG